jgi:hypothetical protein
MPILRVVQTGKSKAFDIIADAPDYQTRHAATAVYVHCGNIVEEARQKTYANDPKPFGPTLRHCHNISEGIINRFHLVEGQELQCDFVQQEGEHHYFINM